MKYISEKASNTNRYNGIPMQWLSFISVLAVSSATGMAQAATSGSRGNAGEMLMSINAGMALVTLVIFTVLLMVLGKYAWRPLIEGLKSRENAIRDSIQAAADAQAQVEQTRKQLEEKIADVQRQAAQQLQQAKIDAAKAADLIRQRAESESRALKDQALRDIQAAKQQALADIANHAADISVDIATRIIGREINAQDQRKLLDESLAQLANTIN